MNLTNSLLIVILGILIHQFYPGLFNTVIVGGIAAAVLYGCYWIIARYPEHRRKQRALVKQHEEDEKEYWEYRKKHDAVREKYDPRHEWNEATRVPQEYLKEIRSLNLSYEGMLRRRNGWTDQDFGDRGRTTATL